MFGFIVVHRLALWRNRRDEYLRDYATFSGAFDHAIEQIKSKGTTLNILILGEYPKHEVAMSAFIHHLKGKRKQRFQDKWNEYNGIYQKLKSLGHAWVAAIMAITPSPDSPTTPQDLDRYERDRTQNYFRIIQELLEIGKIEHWL